MPIYITFKYKTMYSKEIKLDPISRVLSSKFSKLLILAGLIITAFLTA